MFILFGTKDRAVEFDSGQFHCPNCNVKKEYGKKYVQDWFTLFFIPIFPISGKKNNPIECKECQSIYHLEVIDYKPALNQNEMESKPGHSPTSPPVEVLLPQIPKAYEALEKTISITFKEPEDKEDERLIEVAKSNAFHALERLEKRAQGHGMKAVEEVAKKLQ